MKPCGALETTGSVCVFLVREIVSPLRFYWLKLAEQRRNHHSDCRCSVMLSNFNFTGGSENYAWRTILFAVVYLPNIFKNSTKRIQWPHCQKDECKELCLVKAVHFPAQICKWWQNQCENMLLLTRLDNKFNANLWRVHCNFNPQLLPEIWHLRC